MKVLIVGYGYPSERYPLNGIFSFNQAKLLNQKIKILYAYVDLRSIRRIRKFGFEENVVEGVKIIGINFPLGRIPKFIFLPIQNFLVSVLFKRIYKIHDDIDIVHSHFFDLSYSVAKKFGPYKSKLIVTEHSSAINQKKIMKKNFNLAQFVYLKTDKVIAVSNALKRNIYLNFGVVSEVVHNTYNENVFNLNVNYPKESEYTIISVGNLNKNKNISLTINAFYFFQLKVLNSRLLIVGIGPELKELRKLVSNLHLDRKVHFLGQLKQKDLANKLKSSNLLVSSSYSETFGVNIIEALAIGIPVIATKSGGPEDIVNKKNGKLVNISINDITKAIFEVYEDRNFFKSIDLNYYTVSKFGKSRFIARMISIYKGVKIWKLKKTFSFLILTYNHEEFIIENLESIRFLIIKYGKKINFGLIISDDCSVDRTIKLIKRWMTLGINKNFFRRFKLKCSISNQGIVKNYIDGLYQIKTNDFKILAGDDLFGPFNFFHLKVPSALGSTSVYQLIENKIKLVYGKLRTLRDNHLKQSQTIVEVLKFKKIMLQALFFKYRDIWTAEYFDFLQNFEYYEDFATLFYFLSFKKNVIIIPKAYVIYRKKSQLSYSKILSHNATEHSKRSEHDKKLILEIENELINYQFNYLKGFLIDALSTFLYLLKLIKYVLDLYKVKLHYKKIVKKSKQLIN